jgi:hypothetical protein
MRITFKATKDKTENQIFFNDQFIGSVRLNVFSQKWMMYPNFKMFHNENNQGYYSSYEAGKEMVDLYKFLFPEIEEYENQESGMGLHDMLTFLKTRI